MKRVQIRPSNARKRFRSILHYFVGLEPFPPEPPLPEPLPELPPPVVVPPAFDSYIGAQIDDWKKVDIRYQTTISISAEFEGTVSIRSWP
jgi:hypothetical protein